MSFEFSPTDPKSHGALRRDYYRTLVAPMDDMWAAFAEMADTFTMELEGVPIGFFSVNDEGELHRFYVRPAFEHRADALFRHVLARRAICAALPATVDPAFTSLSMDLAQGVEVKALLFQHAVDPEPIRVPLATMRRAEEADFEVCVAFEKAAIGAPLTFLQPYLTARIGAGELLLHEVDGAILGVGSCAETERTPDTRTLASSSAKRCVGRGWAAPS